VHWSLLHKGNIMLRDDSAMNLSPKMFAEFVEPYDQRLLNEFGGGALHFCGKGDHYIARIPEMRGVYAVQMSQPEYNDMEKIFTHTVDKGIPLLRLPRKAAQAALQQGRDLHGLVHSD
jgi:uroporphyrinogen-III decarboxylase